ncbi:tubulin-specific chaperone c [Lasius niger]|uniref:Tubulin-specific chaperone c n=1 Tax=Lasius niger TaxID=67767 RepID=A0A0J7KWV0_LASNI|nr:tubulin-specific chaperone c [Lasius niger]
MAFLKFVAAIILGGGIGYGLLVIASPNESEIVKIKDMLDDAASIPSSALPGIFEKSNKEIQLLKNYLLQSKIFLKVYDIRRAQENLQMLENEASELEMKLLPKKKFGFKNRRIVKKPSDKGHDITDGLKDVKISESIINGSIKQNNKLSSKYGDNACMLVGKVNEQLVLDAENVNKNDILLSDLIQCTVRIYGTPSTLHMMRLHSSTDCTIYLHVTSRAIIEDCTKIYVAPYNWSYEDQMSHFNLAGLDPKVNNWNCIDDFNWLSSEKHSPNWSILEPELRVKTWD